MTDLTTDELLETIRSLGYSYKKPDLPKARKVTRFERLMNRLGWYRQTEVLVIDSGSLFSLNAYNFKPFPWKADQP